MVKTYRANVLTEFGATANEVEELLIYNTNIFKVQSNQSFPLEDELFISTWGNYEREGRDFGVFTALKEKLIQLQFPIQKGISETAFYQAATRRGLSTEHMIEATGLHLKHPELLELFIYQTAAGNIPILIVRDREDFVTLVQAVARKNEPIPIPDAMGACMISGYNNWDRVLYYKKKWEQKNKDDSQANWQTEFQAMAANKTLFQDRFMILSDGPYSGITADKLQLSKDEWRELSLIIRREHEATHYFTQRALGSMRNNMLDELIADYVGIVSAVGEYKAEWFLHFIGLENKSNCRADGRIHGYRGSLSDGAFQILQKLIVNAVENVEQFHSQFVGKLTTEQEKAQIILTLAEFTLEELASIEGFSMLAGAYKKWLLKTTQNT